MSRIRFSPAVKRHAVDLALHSPFFLAEVARQTGCSIRALQLWIKKYRHEQNSVTETASTPSSAFVPITLVDPKPTSVEIVTPNGYTIRIDDIAPLSLHDLLVAIASC